MELQPLETSGRERVLVLVKALPQVGEKFGETVCCAGITTDLQWRRLYPIRFRYLQSNDKFRRWQWLDYDWKLQRDDRRPESRRIVEETLSPGEELSPSHRSSFLNRVVVTGRQEVVERGETILMIRPKESKFSWRKKSLSELETERERYLMAVRQLTLFDEQEEMKALNPCPYEFSFRFLDDDGWHENVCGDWEISATFYNFSKRLGEEKALVEMERIFGHEYPEKGMVFVLGTHSRYPTTWLLIGVVRLDRPGRPVLPGFE
ncbi:MAG: hypothetical protein G8345_12525 [Magnetococcales bacterium]|nr:hypothetical protein [Magnetococcales bacterium]NGZ27699.1 hypothetical protein [Magnetococcales bacterium]